MWLRDPNSCFYKFYSRIQGQYPIFVPRESRLAEKLTEKAHIQTIHRGVTLNIAKIRSKYWVSRLRQLVKRVLRICYGCKKFHVRSQPVLTSERVVASRAYKRRFTNTNHRYRLRRAFLVQVKSEEGKKSVSFTVHLQFSQSYSFRGAIISLFMP